MQNADITTRFAALSGIILDTLSLRYLRHIRCRYRFGMNEY